MVRTERLSPGVSSKLRARGTGPFKILKQIGPNAYVVDIPLDFGVSPTFNVADLVSFTGQAAIPSDPFEPASPFVSEPTPERPPAPLRGRRELIDRILDEQITNTRNRVYQRYLVRWKDRPQSEDSWISKEELQHLDPDLLERYQSDVDPCSTGSSFPHPRRVGGDTVQPSLWLGPDCSAISMS